MKKLVLLAVPTLLISLGGCSSNSAAPAGSAAPSGAANIYVTNFLGSVSNPTGQILTFPASSSGTVSPTSTLSDPANIGIGYITSDANGNIYAISSTGFGGANTSIAVYTHTTAGVLILSRTITSTALTGVSPIAVDKSGNLYVGENTGNKILVFSPTANGASTPTATIAGYSGVMATDPSGNLYVTSATSVVEFNASSITSGVPSRTISGAGFVQGIQAMATDASGNLYVLTFTNATPNDEVLVFSSTASGSATPVRTITGPATKMIEPTGLAVDAAGTIYVSDFTVTAPLEGQVLEFSSTANGNVAPSASFTSAAVTNAEEQIAVF